MGLVKLRRAGAMIWTYANGRTAPRVVVMFLRESMLLWLFY